MKISRRKTLKQVRDEKDLNRRGKVTLYLNLKAYEKFQNACDGEPASSVIEKLMQQFIDSST